ncbi:hypothetical protein CPLU01_10517 [Colletotrichum plurivorum]|uniref:Heterokaryon incompatibility domain-containing protein n=1 Tax=Colletotrichum plurivorum TaxID=2175906 RepID=A0A8H6N9E3_9PEZI|nr:hypothetical protein CPLU01_10517 [Colletotrichum plurivorum]
MSSDLYERLPLDPCKKQTRLIRIHPAEWEEKLKLDLFVANLSDEPKYRALSYVWGEPRPSSTYTAIVNDAIVPVTENLYLAFRRVRGHAAFADTALWVDALCIDQSSVEERGHQVGIMGEIYSNCTEGLTFTGGEGDYGEQWEDFEHAFGAYWSAKDIFEKYIQGYSRSCNHSRLVGLRAPEKLSSGESAFHLAWLIRQLPERNAIERTVDPYLPVPHDLYDAAETDVQFADYWASVKGALRIVVDDPWWQRLWVVQELALPRDVHFLFGPVSVPCDYFAMAMYSLTTSNVLGYSDTDLICKLSRYWNEITNLRPRHGTRRPAMKKAPILVLRQLTFHRDATDDHDQVFSVLGLSRSTLRPNYAESPAVAYTRMCEESVLVDKRLMILSYAGTKAQYADLPSWVIDWSIFKCCARRKAWYEMWSVYSTSSICNDFPEEAACQVNPVVDGRRLLVDGAEMDQVKELLPDLSSGSENRTGFGEWLRMESVYRESEEVLSCPGCPTDSYPGGWLWGEVWLRTLCLDTWWGRKAKGKVDGPLRVEGFAELLAFSGFEGLDMDPETFERRPEDRKIVCCKEGPAVRREEQPTGDGPSAKRSRWTTLREVIDARMFERRLFVTEKGLLGSTNKSVTVGDRVFLLPGVAVPIILRPVHGEQLTNSVGMRLIASALGQTRTSA